MEADEKFLRSFFQKATTRARRRPHINGAKILYMKLLILWAELDIMEKNGKESVL